MKIHDLPLPLRLRNSLVKAGFTDDTGLRDWLNLAPAEDRTIPGVGSTGMLQLYAWVDSIVRAERAEASETQSAAPKEPVVIRRPKPASEKTEKRVNGHDLDADASIYRRDDVATPGRWGRYTAGDATMRGGLESLSERRDWADLALQQAERASERASTAELTARAASVESLDARRKDDEARAIHRRQFDAAMEREVERSFSLLGTGSFGDPAMVSTFDAELSARVASMRYEAARLHAETTVSTSKDTLTLRLEHELQTQIAQMIPLIKGLAHVKELGVEVSRETVARMALIRGLDALERQYKGKNDAKTDENPPETPAEAPVSAAEPKNGVHPTPDGWTKCGPTDKIPVAQAVIHDYYTQNNWFRYWGKAGDSVIYFYWSPEVQFQDLDVFPGTDKNGKTVAVQDTPWGPGHIIPVNWTNQ